MATKLQGIPHLPRFDPRSGAARFNFFLPPSSITITGLTGHELKLHPVSLNLTIRKLKDDCRCPQQGSKCGGGS